MMEFEAKTGAFKKVGPGTDVTSSFAHLCPFTSTLFPSNSVIDARIPISETPLIQLATKPGICFGPVQSAVALLHGPVSSAGDSLVTKVFARAVW